ncbi:DNA (cytosine-5-)-methyltransferase [Paenibacillus alvei]|uniref:Cytosine-specific methyltransferase n=1 Tax=Paenibacillus alvei TaxID=44250 RepID=A0ABT4GVC9_PAEAL|nr:DNA (cytosine-5-)-methyltransferase [Paenibacillus alvei]MCY9760404.1 DNA (cytosine-5-)-methyltransferase [Paenibacillus alvei]MCY9767696.1 DNA (cytosine-5-)-methyltransferase [Paenibacillus alvei]
MSRFDYIELFAGIGGFRSALGELGGSCVFASEIDRFAQQSYKALYDGAPELRGDITKIDARTIPDHDLLVGGFPCQAFSVAGQRKGFEDTRGTLFFEIARIAKVKQPRMMLLENVKGLLSHDKGRTIEVMAQALNDIGYAIDFAVLNSKYFGVPQNRERIFIVAHRDIAQHEPWNIEGNNVVSKAKKRIQTLGVKTFNFDWPTNNTVTKRLRDVLESEVDSKYYLSEEKTAKLIEQLNERQDSNDVDMVGHVDGVIGHDICKRVYATSGISPTIPTGSSGNTTPKIAVECVGNVNPSGNGMNGAVYSDRGLSPTLTTNKGEGTKILTNEVRPVLTPDHEEKRQNGRRFKENDEEAFTLTAQDKHGIAIGRYPRYRIRKLTPRECWRLQGFADEKFDKAKAAGLSDSQLYKQAGNAVTVNVISATSRRLIRRLLTESVGGNRQASENQRMEAVV